MILKSDTSYEIIFNNNVSNLFHSIDKTIYVADLMKKLRQVDDEKGLIDYNANYEMQKKRGIIYITPLIDFELDYLKNIFFESINTRVFNWEYRDISTTDEIPDEDNIPDNLGESWDQFFNEDLFGDINIQNGIKGFGLILAGLVLLQGFNILDDLLD
ncbi:MAG: hypothetical protein ACOCP4_02575 [Candidatus Woesearchaeota archaeon]